MFDLKSLVTKAVEDKTLNVNEYIFMPERVDMMVKDGRLSCVLNTNGKVDFIYHKSGITEVRSGLRKSPFTSFRNELHYGVYDDVVDEVIEAVEKMNQFKGHPIVDIHCDSNNIYNTNIFDKAEICEHTMFGLLDYEAICVYYTPNKKIENELTI